MAPSEKDTISITPKQIGVILAIILAVIGGLPIGVNKLTPDVRSDPFTGADGIKLKAEIQRECRAQVAILQDEIDRIHRDDNDLKTDFKEFRKAYDDHILWGRKQTNIYNETLGRHEGQIQFLLNP